VVLQVDAQNLLGIVNRGSSKLSINELARDLFWFCLRHRITNSVEWVPREENAFVDEISKSLIPEDWMLSRSWFHYLDYNWGPHTVDLFVSNANNQRARFFSLHCRRGSSGINTFAQQWNGENCWVSCQFGLIRKV
jgi:hypothetical protein